ncbi:MAG: hypothetical protein EBU96_06120 [Actinobacteria bacterium]|nr:hypothetical protein [Actinomycetota bacterium]
MEILYTALVVLHVVGIVAIGYGFFKELAKKTFGVNVAMLHGASTQLLTGVLMVGLRESGVVADDEVLDMSRIALKLIIAIAIVVLYSIGKRKSEQKLYWSLIGSLTLTNIIIAYAL